MVGYITCKAIIALNPYTNSVILSRFGIRLFSGYRQTGFLSHFRPTGPTGSNVSQNIQQFSRFAPIYLEEILKV